MDKIKIKAVSATAAIIAIILGFVFASVSFPNEVGMTISIICFTALGLALIKSIYEYFYWKFFKRQ